MSVTMHDVARRSGVSVATVSNVVTGTVPVADGTRARVLDAIDELGYRTNEVARSLKRRATQTLGVVMPDVLNPFHAAIARQIERRAHHDGFAVVISATEYDRDTEADQVRALVRRRVDGVIFPAVTEGSAIPGELLDRGIPVVVVSFAAHDPRLGVVDIDEAEAMMAVVGHLAALGHSRIAFAPATMREEAIDRRPEALRQALAAHGLDEIGMLDSPTAVCCNNDITAMELLDALERRGRRVPETMSVVGFDDIPIAGHARVGLTTVRQDAELMGGIAAEMLLEAIADGRHPSRRVLVPTELVARTSTGPAPEA